MGITHRKAMGTIVWGLAVVLLSCPLAVEAQEGQSTQKKSDQLLLDIMDMHAGLATNQVFIAQAAVVAAYLETARGSEEAMKIEIYTRVHRVLAGISHAPAPPSAKAQEPKVDARPSTAKTHSVEAPAKYTRGAALLEVFKSDSLTQLPKLPLVRTYWKQRLASEGRLGVEVPRSSYYVARFTFWYEAVEPGEYGFTLDAPRGVLTVGGVEVVKSSGRFEQGMCTLEKGFHRVEFCVRGQYNGDSFHFDATIHPPGAFNPVPLTADMMLLPADQVKGPEAGQLKKAGGQGIPYVDY